jgi:hypothetical protein
MTTYQLEINEDIPLGKSIVVLLQSASEVVSLKKYTAQTTLKKDDAGLYKHLDSAFKDVKLMMDGKKKEKALDELIYELRNSND